MKKISGVLIVLGVLYPIVIFSSIYWFHFSARYIAFAVLTMGILAFFINRRSDKKNRLDTVIHYVSILVIVGIFVVTLVVDSIIALKFYPVIVNLPMLIAFLSSLKSGPNMIQRIAMNFDKRLTQEQITPELITYTRLVTKIWIWFFVINITISISTTVFFSDEIWTLYNGLISYVLMGLLFSAEFIYRKYIRKI